VILNQIICPDQDLNHSPPGNLLKSSVHCVKQPGQADGACIITYILCHCSTLQATAVNLVMF